jgi:hypothetical protein
MRKITVKRGQSCEGARSLLERVTRSQHIFRATFNRRTDLIGLDGKTILQPKGAVRHMLCKIKPNLKPTKNWRSKGGQLPFDPASHDLFHVYTTEGQRGNDGRGNHWGFICLRTLSEVRCSGRTYKVVD